MIGLLAGALRGGRRPPPYDWQREGLFDRDERRLDEALLGRAREARRP